MQIVLFEDEKFKNFYPISRMRTVADLRTGVWTQRERAEKEFDKKIFVHSNREHFGDTIEKKDTLFLNARLKEFSGLEHIEPGSCIMYENNYIAYRGDRPLSLAELKNIDIVVKEFPVYEYIWEIIADLPEILKKDLNNISEPGKISSPLSDSVTIDNKSDLYIGNNTVIGSGVELDASAGSIFISNDVTIGAHSIIRGPIFIGESCMVKPGSLLDTISVGKVTKLSGEIEESIFQGYANKQHLGFLGHSYVGKWVNLGAGTTNSDLKNNYSPISVNMAGVIIQTDLQFLGLIIGDHSKTAINTRFNTGTIVEPFCNIFGRDFPPKYLPPFSWWGGKLSEYELDKAIETARKVMLRRGIEMESTYEWIVRQLFNETIGIRENKEE